MNLTKPLDSAISVSDSDSDVDREEENEESGENGETELSGESGEMVSIPEFEDERLRDKLLYSQCLSDG